MTDPAPPIAALVGGSPAAAALLLDGETVIDGMSINVRGRELEPGIALLTWEQSQPAARGNPLLGRVRHTRRWTACHRAREPFWMVPAVGSTLVDVPPETQVLLIERGDGRLVLIAPLALGAMRFALRGGAEGLTLVGHTGDPWTRVATSPACLVAIGDCPLALWQRAASALAAAHPEVGLARDVPYPREADWLGWCTWDAFYQTVDEAKVVAGLESFRRIGVMPRWMILDDGWQTQERVSTGEQRLTAFAADAVKFPNGLGPLVTLTKQRYGLRSFWVWHAFQGYWGGTDARLGYQIEERLRRYDAGIVSNPPANSDWMQEVWGDLMGVVTASDIGRFFADFHANLRAQGVDGVKVDNQAALEGVAHGLGGRVALMRAYRDALEVSVTTHFGGSLINCMSCSNDMLYAARCSNSTRTSTDFWPKKPESHGLHLYTNAQVGGWFGEFVHPDWDIFQTAHPAGWFHAAGRAVSGAQVYVSDAPDHHDAAVLLALTLSDGSVPRCLDPGRPTRDCLFHDPTREPVLLKVMNRNPCGTVIGIFNACHDSAGPVAGGVSPSDHPQAEPGVSAVWLHRIARLALLEHGRHLPLALTALDWEIATMAPVVDGLAVIGLEGKLNGGGVVIAVRRQTRGASIELRDGGTLLVWCAQTLSARSARQPLEVTPATDGLVRVTIVGQGPCVLDLRW